jgi:PAS domain S-box-containing protein
MYPSPSLTGLADFPLLEHAPDAMVVVDAQGRIQLVNAQTERLFGYDREELVGRPVETLVPSRFRDLHVGDRREYSTDPRVRRMGRGLELFGLRKNGSEFPVLYTATAMNPSLCDFMQMYQIQSLVPKPSEPPELLAAVERALTG